MKKFSEFLLENELEDLRMDLMGLGFTRWEVEMWGKFTDEDWEMDFSAKGKGDSKEEAAGFALSAILKMLYEPTEEHSDISPYTYRKTVNKMVDFDKWDKSYLHARESTLVKKTLSNTLYTQDLYSPIYREQKLFVKVREYEGLKSGGMVQYEKWTEELDEGF